MTLLFRPPVQAPAVQNLSSSAGFLDRTISNRYSNAYWVLGCFILGNALTLMQPDLFSSKVLAVVLIIACPLLIWLLIRWRYLLPLIAILLGLCSASIQFQSHIDSVMPSHWERKDIELVARVIGMPTVRGADISFRVSVIQQRQSKELDGLIGQRLQLSCYRCKLDINAGERWRFTVRLKRPHGYASKGAFDYEKYLFRHKIVAKGYLRLKSPNQLIQPARLNLHQWRADIKTGIHKALDSSNVTGMVRSNTGPSNKIEQVEIGKSIITALSIGDKSGFTSKQRQVLQASGLSHLFAISGLHIGLIFATVMLLAKYVFNLFPSLFERMPRSYLCLIPAMMAALVYAGLAGFAVSTQRALLMLVIFVVTRVLVRDVSLLKVLLIAASLILIFDPFALLDVGFWLSCGAVVTIYLATSTWPNSWSNNDRELKNGESKASKLKASKLKESKSPNKSIVLLFKLQVGLWFGMAPLTGLFFGHISLVSPLLNLIAVPLFCVVLIPITLLGVLLGEVGLLSLSKPVLLCMNAVYQWIFFGLEWLAEKPFSTLSVESIDGWLWGLGVLLILLVFVLRAFDFRAFVLNKWTLLSVLLLSSLMLTAQPLLPYPTQRKTLQQKLVASNHDLTLTLLDVGQGLSMVIQAGDQVTVYDTGPKYSSGFTAAQAVLLPYLRANGINKIDQLIISHADNDHIGGYDVLNEAIEIENTLTSRTDKLPLARECLAGQRWAHGITRFSIISPDSTTAKGSNNRSCVLRIEHQGVSVLITGDIEKRVERQLLANSANLQASIMLVPHQGSKTSSTAAFIDAVNPELALVAAGYLNHYGHPHPKVVKRYVDRGIPLLSTVDSGSIEIHVSEGGYKVGRFRSSSRRFWHWRG